VRRMKPQLEKGIEEYSFALHGNLTPKKIRDAWDKARESSHPILVIATPQFLSLPRSDMRTIIVEEEASRTYRGVSRPYIDGRLFAEFFAEESHARLIFGDVLLRTETLWKKMNDEYVDLIPLKFRSLSSAEARIVDMREEADEEKKRFRIFSDELERLVLSTKENNERLFLFGARKGYAGSTVCADCGEIVRCNNCGAPVAVYMLNADEGYFYCNKCGERRDAKERCAVCDSWNLTMLGVGVERIEDELRKRFPDIQAFRLDKESVSTEKKALEIAEKFRETPGSILVGTELALIYMREIAENAAVVSIDTLFAVPDFRINEKLFHILLQIRSLAEKRFVIQTRNIGEKIFQYAVQGNLMDFYRDEIAMRKQFQYPPWSLFVKVSLEGPRTSVEAEMRKLQKFLEPFQADVLTSFDSPSAKRHQMHALIKVKAQEWPNPALLEKLRALPPTFKIKVDPDTLI
jgi:primosomal protein N' (replication factor Y)